MSIQIFHTSDDVVCRMKTKQTLNTHPSSQEVVLSLLILRNHLRYACIYVQQGYVQKTPFFLCAKKQHESRKRYGTSEVAM